MSSVILAQDLKRSFGTVEAVRGVDITVEEGEIFGFLGPNGAGKSTVVKMLTTLLVPTSGSGEVLGYDLRTQTAQIRLRIGVALQEASLDKKQTGREILRLQGRLYGLSQREVDQRIDQLSSLIEFDAIDRRVETYSGGMERRLDLAASLMHNPDLLFLDEPTTGLDPQSRAYVWQEVKRLNAELGTTIFLTTQYLEEADMLADRVGIINEGLLVAQGTPDDLKRSVGADVVEITLASSGQDGLSEIEALDVVDHVEVGDNRWLISVKDGASSVAPIAVCLDKAGVDVKELTLRTPSLDDVFFEITGGRIEI